MNRRDFLKNIGLATSMVVIPNMAFSKTHKNIELENIVTSDYSHFNPNHQYGNAVMIAEFNDKVLKDAYQMFETNIVSAIPPGYRKNIKWVFRKPGTDIGFYYEVGSIAWKYVPVK